MRVVTTTYMIWLNTSYATRYLHSTLDFTDLNHEEKVVKIFGLVSVLLHTCLFIIWLPDSLTFYSLTDFVCSGIFKHIQLMDFLHVVIPCNSTFRSTQSYHWTVVDLCFVTE